MARVDLPEPFGPHEGMDLARPDGEVDAPEDRHALDRDVQAGSTSSRGCLPVSRSAGSVGGRGHDVESSRNPEFLL